MTSQQNHLLIQGSDASIQTHHYNLYYQTQDNHGLDEFFFACCAEKKLNYNKKAYWEFMNNLEEFKIRRPLSDTTTIQFVMAPSKESYNDKIIRIELYNTSQVTEASPPFCILSMSAEFKQSTKTVMDCHLWMLEKNLSLVDKLADDLATTKLDIIQDHLKMIKELTKICSDTIKENHFPA